MDFKRTAQQIEEIAKHMEMALYAEAGPDLPDEDGLDALAELAYQAALFLDFIQHAIGESSIDEIADWGPAKLTRRIREAMSAKQV